ncbi:MAG: M48 family metallopeptidase [Candidatus Eisenbacteria bacterium]
MRRPRFWLLCLLVLAAFGVAHAAHAAGAADSTGASVRDYLAEARAGFTPENRAYSHTRVFLRLVGPLYGILAGLFVMFSGLSARFRDIAHGLGHRRYVRVLVYFSLYATAIFLLSLPLAWFEDYALEHQYGLSTQTLLGWFGDQVKAQVFSIVVVGVVPLLALAWWRIEASPRGWWKWIAAGTLPVMLVGVVLQPVVFDPLFNKFTPLRDAELRTEILSLASKAGIPGRHVYEVDMSSKTRKINAYVSGFGASQRIVLWDTALASLKRDEILFVMGHEMGHYVLGHMWQYLLVISAGAFLAFWACARLAELWLRGFGAQWGVREVSDLAAMPVLSLSLTLVTLATLPALNWLSCRVEHESDVYALELTHDNDAGARSFLQLAKDNRSDPEPPTWVRVLLYDHPPLGERIRFALEYRPWEKGEPNRLYRPKPPALAAR